jgi:tRNA threonylcarbamoyladenosine biosynthesis protein TsaB
MNVLAFDLSTRRGSIALLGADQNFFTVQDWPNDRRNSAPFFSALDQIIRAQGAPDRIVVGLGPGSYTGTRIAISAAIGLQLTCGARVCGLPSTCAISSEDDYAVIGDAKRASFFFSRIICRRIAGEIELLSENELADRISELAFPVYTADQLRQFPRAQLRFPRAELLARFALADENLARGPLEPIYLRPSHITSPRTKQINDRTSSSSLLGGN